MNKINLLDYRNKAVAPGNFKHQRLLRRSSFFLLFITGISSIVIFMFIAISPLPQIERERKTASVNLSLLSKDVAMLSLAKERADSVDGIIKSRNKYDKLLESLITMLPRGVSVDSLTVKEKNFSLTVTSKSLRALDQFLEKVTQNKTEYAGVALNGLKTDTQKNLFYLSLNITII